MCDHDGPLVRASQFFRTSKPGNPPNATQLSGPMTPEARGIVTANEKPLTGSKRKRWRHLSRIATVLTNATLLEEPRPHPPRRRSPP